MTREVTSSLVALCVVLSVVAVGVPTAMATDEGGAHLHLESTTGVPGTNVTVTVYAENVSNVAGHSTNITFDSSVVQVVDVSNELGTVSAVNVDNQQGWVHVAGANATGTDNPVLAEITFNVVGDFNQSVSLDFIAGDTSLNDAQGNDIPLAALVGGSITIPAESDVPSMTLGAATGAPGETVSVTLDTRQATDVAGFDAMITFDPNVVQVSSVDGLDIGTVVSSINNTAGTVNISAAGTSGLDSPALANITFTIVGAVGDETVLALSDTKLFDSNGEAVPHLTTDGNIYVANASIQIGSATGLAGDNVTVTVSADADQLSGFDANVTFDSSVLSVVDVSKAHSDSKFTVSSFSPTGVGYVKASGAASSPVGPDPDLVEITFHIDSSANPGRVPLRFHQSDTKLYDKNGTSIPIGYERGGVSVQTCKVGDANGDDSVNAGDAVVVLRFSAGQISELPGSRSCADANGDGGVNAGDAVVILRFSAGQISELPPS